MEPENTQIERNRTFDYVAKLIFREAGEESVVLSTAYIETSTYMWCNSRDYILSLHREAHDNKIILTKEEECSGRFPVQSSKKRKNKRK